jgi:hypothetical protein
MPEAPSGAEGGFFLQRELAYDVLDISHLQFPLGGVSMVVRTPAIMKMVRNSDGSG